MKKATIWSLIIVLILLLYLAFTVLFTVVFRQITARQAVTPPTPVAPLPITATAPIVAVVSPPTNTPLPPTPSPIPSATPTDIPSPTEIPTLIPTATPARPQVVSAVTVNVRAGPGTNYSVINTLPPGVPVGIVGQNQGGTWWQIQGPDGATGWVSNSVVEASFTQSVPVVAAPPPPQPTPAPVPTTPPKPKFQYEPTGWYGDVNYGLTRFLGEIKDANGNPINGVFVEAQCGDYRIISNPSGPVGWGPFNESHTWAPGFYDITLDNKPIVCTWFLSVVETNDKENVTARLSDRIEVETTVEESIITANWRKNW
jgi:uncharacterized protein YgiM (DUF1202 family)